MVCTSAKSPGASHQLSVLLTSLLHPTFQRCKDIKPTPKPTPKGVPTPRPTPQPTPVPAPAANTPSPLPVPAPTPATQMPSAPPSSSSGGNPSNSSTYGSNSSGSSSGGGTGSASLPLAAYIGMASGGALLLLLLGFFLFYCVRSRRVAAASAIGAASAASAGAVAGGKEMAGGMEGKGRGGRITGSKEDALNKKVETVDHFLVSEQGGGMSECRERLSVRPSVLTPSIPPSFAPFLCSWSRGSSKTAVLLPASFTSSQQPSHCLPSGPLPRRLL